MSLTYQVPTAIVAEHAFTGERIVRGHASATGSLVVVASQRHDDRTLTVTRLVRRHATVDVTQLGTGRGVGAIAVSASGARVAYDLDGELHFWQADRHHAAPAPADRLTAAAWCGEDRLAVAAGLTWPPLHVLNADGSAGTAVEPFLPDAPHHRPCLAASGSTVAFCWVWTDVTVVPEPLARVPQTVLKADTADADASLALGVWFVDGGTAVVVAPWPDTRGGAPLVLFTGRTAGAARLEPALSIPCAAVVAPVTSSQAIAAPLERPGAIVSYGPGGHHRLLGELPRRVWAVHPRQDGGLVAWTEDSVYWLDPTS